MAYNPDWAKAARWYEAAAEQGYARAQYNLGLCYYDGQGVAKDSAKAVHWFEAAAEQGSVRAQFDLGVCYANGEGVEQDWARAVHWYEAAAEQGLANAQCSLGACYANGEGVEQDWAKAARWYEAAAEQGYARAQFDLGVCYANGEGVEQDWAKAAHWFEAAAQRGHTDAQRNLALCNKHIQGLATPPESGLAQAPAPVASSGKSGGCYVATAVYGSYDCPEVWTLRRFRDTTLAGSVFGRCFVRVYYAVSPTLVRHFGRSGWFLRPARFAVGALVKRLQDRGVSSDAYTD